jgi:hypothetical protein
MVATPQGKPVESLPTQGSRLGKACRQASDSEMLLPKSKYLRWHDQIIERAQRRKMLRQ